MVKKKDTEKWCCWEIKNKLMNAPKCDVAELSFLGADSSDAWVVISSITGLYSMHFLRNVTACRTKGMA